MKDWVVYAIVGGVILIIYIILLMVNTQKVTI